MWTAAWLSGARSTLILLAFGFVGLLAMWAGEKGVFSRRFVMAGTSAALVVLALFIVARPERAGDSPVGRLVTFLPSASLPAIAYELFWRRDGYGLAAVEAIKAHPVHGVGIGRFASLAPGYSGRVEPKMIPPDNAQNLWRQTLAERGLLGFAPIAWLTVLTLQALVRRPRPMSDPPALEPHRGVHPIVLRAMVAGFGVSMLFGYPVQDPAVGVTLATLVGCLVAGAGSSAGENDTGWAGWVWLVLLSLALAGAALDYAA
jgi:O-antigen ligase